MKKGKKILGSLLLVFMLFLTACTAEEIEALDSLLEAGTAASFGKRVNEALKGLEVNVKTYDTDSQIIDTIQAKSVMISRNRTFDTKGDSRDSSVLTMTIGENEVHHVGSSMIIEENGLENIFDEYAKTVDIVNLDRGVPIVNSMVNKFKNNFTGKSKVVLIRSQHGVPLATYAGNNVSLHASTVPESTRLMIDGKFLFIYRADFTVYDLDLLGEDI